MVVALFILKNVVVVFIIFSENVRKHIDGKKGQVKKRHKKNC
jgi:hypothetical protein